MMAMDPGTPFPADMGEKTGTENSSCPPQDKDHSDPGAFRIPDVSTGMTLEQIIDITGEFAHLNELVVIHIQNAGGFVGTGAYFRMVQPLLDLLEVEIRARCGPGITQQQMKLIVHDWIDEEIKVRRKEKPVRGA
jgi:hypothetical protein